MNMMNDELKNLEELCSNVRAADAVNKQTSKSNRHVAISQSPILYFYILYRTCDLRRIRLTSTLLFLSFISLPECIVESCVNCGVCSSTDVCAYFTQLNKCRYCHRRLPLACFTTCNRMTCRGCAKRSTEPYHRNRRPHDTSRYSVRCIHSSTCQSNSATRRRISSAIQVLLF